MIDDASLELLHPKISWREPIKVERTDGAWGWACRLCIARNGLNASEIIDLGDDIELVRAHLELEHPRTLVEPEPRNV